MSLANKDGQGGASEDRGGGGGCGCALTAVEDRMLANLSDRPELIYERLQLYWSLIGLVGEHSRSIFIFRGITDSSQTHAQVGALFGGFAYAAFISPNNWSGPNGDDDDGMAPAQYIAAFSNGLASATGICCAILSSILFAFLNASPQDKANDFVETFKSQMPGPMIFMMAALMSLVLAAIVVSYTTYGIGVMVFTLLLWIAGLIWLSSIYTKVFKSTEFIRNQENMGSLRKMDNAELARVLRTNAIIGYVSATEVHLLENFEYTDEIHARLSEYYNLIGVVSALIAGMAFSTFTGPPDMHHHPLALSNFLGVTLTISSLAGVLSSLLATIYYALINLTPPALCKTWAIKSLRDLGKPLLLLVVSVASMGLSMLVMTQSIYGTTALVLTILMCEY